MSYFLCLTKSMEITAVRRKKHTKCAVPAGANFLQSGKFQKDLVLLVGSCCLSGLIRGLENLEALFGKVLILLVRSRHCGELNRGLENLELPERERFYSFRLYEKNGEYPRGLRTSGLQGAIQSSVEGNFSKVFRRHEPKPAFRTKRRRKGFESVRGSGVTA